MKEFQDAIRAAGLLPPDNITAGKIVAFAGLDKPRGNKAARCFLFLDRRGGWIMDYSTGLFETWQAERETKYTEAERATFREQCKRDQLAREQAAIKGQQETALKARKIHKCANLCGCQ